MVFLWTIVAPFLHRNEKPSPAYAVIATLLSIGCFLTAYALV